MNRPSGGQKTGFLDGDAGAAYTGLMDRNQNATNPVVLVSCYELGHEPLGITVPAGVLERRGIAATLMDVALEEFDEEIVANACFVGISTPMHTALQLGLRVAERVRELNPRAHVCLFGLYAELCGGHLSADAVDTWLGAESEDALAELVARVQASPDPRAVTPPAGTTASARAGREIDLSPHRARLRGRERYVRLERDGDTSRVGCTATTRGCKHVCRHCPLPAAYEGTFYAIPVERVIADIASLVADGARHITLADPDFLNGPSHAERVVRALHAEFPGVSFDYTAKVEHLLAHREMVEAFGEMGNAFVVSAVESLNDTVLANLAKRHTRDDAIALFRWFREHGLVLRPSLLPFTPWETRASLIDLLETVAREELVYHIDPVQYGIRLLVPPGSLLLESEAMKPHLGAFDAGSLSYAWTHPDPEMDALQARIAAIVEAGVGEDTGDVFARVWEAVHGADIDVPTLIHPHTHPPRLTEAWFC